MSKTTACTKAEMAAPAYWSAVVTERGRPTDVVLAKAPAIPGQPCPEEVKRHWAPGKSVAICWNMLPPQSIRRLSEETKARMRENRIKKRYPLLAEQFIAAEKGKP